MFSLQKMRISIIDLIRGTSIIKQMQLLDKEQYFSSDQLNRLSQMQYEKVLSTARRVVPYYKQLAKQEVLPELTKNLIRNNENEFISSEFRGNLIKKSTGGSTGIPLFYYTTVKAQSFMWAGILHAWKIAGYNIGDKVGFITGTSLVKKNWKHSLFYKLMNITVFSVYDLNKENIEKYLAVIRNQNFKLLYGYPTALNEIALYMLKEKRFQFPALKGIVVTSEVLYQTHRENIQNAFGVVVRNQYGCNEGGISAFECEFGNMHLINTAAHVRITENGNAYSTNLVNDGFYFINYDTGDIIKFSEKNKCNCGRGYPIIDEVVGRNVDIVYDKNQKKIHPAFFSILFRNEPSVEQFQISFNHSVVDIYLKVDEKKYNPLKQSELLSIIKASMFFDEYIFHINEPFFTIANAKHKYVIDDRNKN